MAEAELKKSLLKRKWPAILATLIVIVTVVLVGMPMLIEKLMVDWLLENGQDEVIVENVDFNPFTGMLVLEGIEVLVDGEWTHAYESASVDVAWLPLLGQHLVIETLNLRGLQLRVDNSDDTLLRFGGIAIDKIEQTAHPEGDSEAAWSLSINLLRFENINIEYLDAQVDLAMRIDLLEFEQFDQRTPEQPAIVQLNGSVGKAPFEVSGELLAHIEHPAFKGSVSLERFDLSLIAGLVASHLDMLEGAVSLESTIDLASSVEAISVQHQGVIALNDYVLVTGKEVIKGDRLEWEGSARTRLTVESGDLQLDAEGAVQSVTLQAAVNNPPIEVSYEEFNWQGLISVSSAGEALHISSRADARVGHLAFLSRARNLRLGSAERLEVKGLVVENPTNIKIDLISFDDLVIGVPIESQSEVSQAAVSDVDQLLIESIEYSDNRIKIKKIEQNNLVSRMVRDKTGEFSAVRLTALIGEIASPDGSDSSADKDEAGPADRNDDAMNIVIGEFIITGDSQLQYIDQFVSPQFSIVFNVLDASIRNINSSEPAIPSPVRLEARSGSHTKLDIEGTIKPFLTEPELELQLNLAAMDLPHLTPYTNTKLGLDLLSGTLDSHVEIDLADKKLMGEIIFELHQFEVATLDVENSLQSQIPLPLSVALDALRDRDNMIRLEIPVNGNVDDPDFSFDDAIGKALAKGVSKGAMTYLTFALQPYGALLTVAKMAGEEASRLRLKPVDFQEGVSDLDEMERDYLAKVASILRDRPKVAVKLCGVAVARDLEVYRQAQVSEVPATPEEVSGPASQEEMVYLTDLAEGRASRVKDYLVLTHDSDASHLVSCKPTVSLNKPAGQPRTDLLI